MKSKGRAVRKIEENSKISRRRRILAFEFTDKIRNVSLEGNELFLSGGGACPSFDEFDFVVLQSGTFYLGHNTITTTSILEKIQAKENEMIKRERQISNTLEQGKTVCFLLFHADDALVSRVLQLNRIGCYTPWGGELRTDISSKRSEFRDFLKKFGAARVGFSQNVDDTICTVGEVNTGVVKNVGKGMLVFLPCNVPSFPRDDEIIDLLGILSRSLISYSFEHRYELPPWIDALRFPKEIEVRNEIGEHTKKIEELGVTVGDYSRLKSILWLEGNQLDDAVRNFFERIGFQTRKDEGYEEDFWILENNSEQVIVEVKGKGKNLQRQDISRLDEHRAAREKPDDFPALLVVNSFSRANSLNEKDVGISPAELKKARHTHALITRTLDLFNLFALMEEEKIDQKALLTLLKTETGWLKASSDACKVLKE